MAATNPLLSPPGMVLTDTLEPDGDELPLLSRPPFLFFGLAIALLLLGLGLWLATDSDLIASSQAEAAWDAALRSPIDRETPLGQNPFEISMRRSGCFGPCPQYEVRINAAGEVSFLGLHHVCAFGTHIVQVDPYSVRHLLRALEAADFYHLASPRNDILDIAVTTVSLTREEHSKSLAYTRASNDLFIEIGDQIDKVASSSQWLPRPRRIEDRWPVCEKADGTSEQALYEPGSSW